MKMPFLYLFAEKFSCSAMISRKEYATVNNLRFTLQPLYNTVHYNTVLDITQFKDGPKNL